MFQNVKQKTARKIPNIQKKIPNFQKISRYSKNFQIFKKVPIIQKKIYDQIAMNS